MTDKPQTTKRPLAQKVMVSGNTKHREVRLDFLLDLGCRIALEMSIDNAKEIAHQIQIGIAVLEHEEADANV